VLSQNCRRCVDQFCPKRSNRLKEDNPKWESDLTRKIRRARNKAYKKGSPSYKYFDRLLRNMIRKNKKSYITSTVNSLTKSTWWKSLKSISGTSKLLPQGYMIDNNWLDPLDFADALNKFYASVGGQSLQIADTMPDYNTNTTPVCSTDELTVYNILTNIDTRKATHSDDFPSWVSKDNPEAISVPLTNIINTILKEHRFPQKWKEAEIVPVPKSTNPSSLKDYRPISLLYHCSKIAEKIFTIEYKTQVMAKLKKHQFAYQKGISTTDALIFSFEQWLIDLQLKPASEINIILKDFSKAFDMMQPAYLLRALNDFEVTDGLKNLASDFLTGRTQ
jgi:hypothetical protein